MISLERADLVGLVAEVHRAVRMVPVAEHAEALEVGRLLVDLLGRVGAALRLHVAASSLSPTLPNFFSIAFSIGRPWQSQPGT